MLLFLFASALASPLTGTCPALVDGRVVMVDGATLDWAGRSFSCDGERTCEFSLPTDSEAFDATGLVDIAFDCGADEVHLSCVGQECAVARLPAPISAGDLPDPPRSDREGLPVRVGGRLASGA